MHDLLTRWTGIAAIAAIAVAITGCSKPPPASAPAPPAVPVLAMQVIQRNATVTGELVGQVSAFREVPLRPQTTGFVQKILFEPGQRVHEGELLFVIDPRPYQAGLSEAQGAVADAAAALARAKGDVARYAPLLPDNAIPRATYDAAVATEKSAEAALDQRKAAAERARLDVRNTEVRSPVTGQIGLQQVEIGGLATAGQTVLATVSTLDPVYVTFSVPEADYVRFMKGAGSPQAAAEQARANKFQLILPDGTVYDQPGTFDFVERAISTTGTLGVRAKFPNPQNLLRPGMNVRVRLVFDEVQNALLVPQRAVTELLGKQFVTTIGTDNKTGQRAVTLGDRVGEMWIVKSGLAAGERIVVDGIQKAPPGTTVAATMITEAQLDNPPTPAPPAAPAK
ncbi:MAG TPA: efflux RND transporter periplasmic adaptor subunit [Casimicrobiaceae bacterium]|nr:efflux RND transporter periplasmic adaptor subunit [Casimicrobiaceae bacterium]